MNQPTENQTTENDLGEFGIYIGGTNPPVAPSKPIKSHGRGIANTIKYAAIVGLVAGASIIIYTLVF